MQMISEAYRKEMNKFDTERVLIAWDGLVMKQQAALENMRVPNMFVTDIGTDREVRPGELPITLVNFD
jgi:hypothetical protein